MSDLLIMFGSAFLAATFLPFYSEIVLLAQLQAGGPVGLLIAVATLGNVLGSCVNWWLGRWLLRFQHRKWFYFSEGQIHRGQQWFQRYGIWTLLFAWMPVGGDALPLIAGMMRVRLGIFLILVTIGKGARYVVIAEIARQF